MKKIDYVMNPQPPPLRKYLKQPSPDYVICERPHITFSNIKN